MRRPWFLRVVLDEAPLKLLSFVIAVTFFVIVRGDKDASSGVSVKIIYTLPKDRVLVSDPPSELRVGLRGPRTRLGRIDERDFEPVRIDLSSADDGELRITDEMIRLPAGVHVASISPAEVSLRFEPRIEREVPIEPVAQGVVADGFRLAKLRVKPVTVRLEGSRSAMKGLERIATRPFDIAGADGARRGEVALDSPPRHVRVVTRDPVVIEADVEPMLIERTLEAVPVRVVGLQRLEGVPTPTVVTLVLRGPANRVRDLKASELVVKVEIPLADVRPPGRFARGVVVEGLPAGVAAEIRPSVVAVTTRRRTR